VITISSRRTGSRRWISSGWSRPLRRRRCGGTVARRTSRSPSTPLLQLPQVALALALAANELITNALKHASRPATPGASRSWSRRTEDVSWRSGTTAWASGGHRGGIGKGVGLEIVSPWSLPIFGEFHLRNDGERWRSSVSQAEGRGRLNEPCGISRSSPSRTKGSWRPL
jgi:hypothetical protein